MPADVEGIWAAQFWNAAGSVAGVDEVTLSRGEDVVDRNITLRPAVRLLEPPVIAEQPQVGRPVRARPAQWSPSGLRLTYQWLVLGQKIPGATAATYTPRASDRGKWLTVRVSATRAGFPGVAVQSSRSSDVEARGVAAKTKPRITGALNVGRTIRVTSGTWRPADVRLTYRWAADGRRIAGAFGPRLALRPSYAGRVITVTVTARKTGTRRRC